MFMFISISIIYFKQYSNALRLSVFSLLEKYSVKLKFKKYTQISLSKLFCVQRYSIGNNFKLFG